MLITQDVKNPIQIKIEMYEKIIESYHRSLSIEGIWLFLATLGCWSVINPVVQILALVIAIVLFVFRVQYQRKDKRSFPKIEKEIRIMMKDHYNKKESEYLARVKREKLSISHTFSAYGLVFSICVLFWGISLYCLSVNNSSKLNNRVLSSQVKEKN